MVLFPIIFVFLLNMAPALASEPAHTDIHVVEVDHSQLSPTAERELAEMSSQVAHETVSSKGLGQVFKLGEKLKDGYRWAAYSGEMTKYQGMAMDGALLFGVTQSVEKFAGPILVGIGWSSGWPTWLVDIIGMGSVTTSGPGPLTIVMFATLIKSPEFRHQVTKLRIGVIEKAQQLNDIIGLNRLLTRLVYTQSALSQLYENPYLHRVRVFENGKQSFLFEFKNSYSVEIEVVDGKAHLKHASFPRQLSDQSERKELEKSIKSFPGNVASVLRDALLVALGEKQWGGRFFVEKQSVGDGQFRHFEFTDGAIQVNPQTLINRPLLGPLTCRGVFAR